MRSLMVGFFFMMIVISLAKGQSAGPAPSPSSSSVPPPVPSTSLELRAHHIRRFTFKQPEYHAPRLFPPFLGPMLAVVAVFLIRRFVFILRHIVMSFPVTPASCRANEMTSSEEASANSEEAINVFRPLEIGR